MAEKKNKALILQFIMLMCLLIISPVGTYFWMRGGVDYRMERLAELKEVGAVGAFEAIDAKGKLFNNSDIAEKMVLVAFLPDNKQEAKKLVERIELVEHQMEEQLDKRQDMLFLLYTSNENYTNYAKELMEKENDKFNFVKVPAQEMVRLKNEVFLLKDNAENQLVLVDLTGQIRHFYNAMENSEMGRLVEHMAIILPAEEEADIIYKPEKEK